jgi:hypothetical protein
MGLPRSGGCFIDGLLHVVATRIYFVLLGLAAVISADRLGTFAARRWGEILRREPKGVRLGYRFALTLGGLLLIGWGVLWPPGW